MLAPLYQDIKKGRAYLHRSTRPVSTARLCCSFAQSFCVRLPCADPSRSWNARTQPWATSGWATGEARPWPSSTTRAGHPRSSEGTAADLTRPPHFTLPRPHVVTKHAPTSVNWQPWCSRADANKLLRSWALTPRKTTWPCCITTTPSRYAHSPLTWRACAHWAMQGVHCIDSYTRGARCVLDCATVLSANARESAVVG
jgi:hypothetical protein